MTKQEPPATTKDNPYSKLDTDGLKKELAKFSEALKSDVAKDIDILKELKIDAPKLDPDPKANIKNEAPKSEKKLDTDAIKSWTPIYENAKEALLEAGFKFEKAEPETSKMSEANQLVEKRITKIATAKFSEQKTGLLKVDKDFPVEIIEKLDIPVEDRVTIMASMNEVVSRNSEAVAKVQKELDVASKSLEEAQIHVPKLEEKKDGANRIAEIASKMGASELKGVPSNKPAESGAEKLAIALKQFSEETKKQ